MNARTNELEGGKLEKFVIDANFILQSTTNDTRPLSVGDFLVNICLARSHFDEIATFLCGIT